MSSRRNGFDPNQSRDSIGRFAESHGTRPSSGGLSRRPAEEWPEEAWPDPSAHDSADAPAPRVVPDLPPSRWRTKDAPTGDMYYAYRDKRDQALDPASWGGGPRPAESYRLVDDVAQGMLETAPLRIRELVAERYPDATSVVFRNVDGDLRVAGYVTDANAHRTEVHKLVEDDGAMAEEIDTINRDLNVSRAKPSSHDLAGLRVDKAGNWYLPVTEQGSDGPGFARSSSEGVRIECGELELEGLRLRNASDKITRPALPINEITSQRELMWFVEHGTTEEVEQVAGSAHARAAVLHNIAMYKSAKAGASAVMSWQVSEATIRAVHAKTPKTAKAMGDAGLQYAAKAPAEIREEARHPAAYAKQKVAEQKRAASRPAVAPSAEAPKAVSQPSPKHWHRKYTPEQRAYLQERLPIGFDEYGSSQADLWEERQLRSFEQERARHD